jgi:hypothetical protein
LDISKQAALGRILRSLDSAHEEISVDLRT